MCIRLPTILSIPFAHVDILVTGLMYCHHILGFSVIMVAPKQSQILTNDLGLLYKRQIPRSRVEVLQTLSHRDRLHRCGLRLRLTFKTVATLIDFITSNHPNLI
ncbi:MAG: hypothetical protein V7K77_18250 [Nostoc sp.]|uniref:hypothetical protein n=1 Tax=Nostoc sp. TaxID=1180 RepID=UPI002FF80565